MSTNKEGTMAEKTEGAEALAAMRWDEGRNPDADSPAWSELTGCEDMKRSLVAEAQRDIEEIAPFLAHQDQESSGEGRRRDKAPCETCGGRKWVRLDVPPPAYASRRCPDCRPLRGRA